MTVLCQLTEVALIDFQMTLAHHHICVFETNRFTVSQWLIHRLVSFAVWLHIKILNYTFVLLFLLEGGVICVSITVLYLYIYNLTSNEALW